MSSPVRVGFRVVDRLCTNLKIAVILLALTDD